jgi:hypothetical protein
LLFLILSRKSGFFEQAISKENQNHEGDSKYDHRDKILLKVSDIDLHVKGVKSVNGGKILILLKIYV